MNSTQVCLRTFWMALLCLAIACGRDNNDVVPEEPGIPPPPAGANPLPDNPQQHDGSAAAGWDYLRYGNFIGGGVPYALFVNFPGNTSPDNHLQREGLNENIVPGFNAFEVAEGVEVVGGLTCFGCHSASINGQFIPGLGNSLGDFTADNTQFLEIAALAIEQRYGINSPEYEAFDPLYRTGRKAAPYTQLPFQGINPAFMLEQASVAHHDPETFAFLEDPYFQIPDEIIGTDVPPLWNLRKKNALYYPGLGRGDYTKLLMQVSVVAIEDTSTLRTIHGSFDDVLAWIEELEPPAFPGAIAAEAAARGETVFRQECAPCHGTYGDEASYPNLLVDLPVVGTDPAYARYFVEKPQFTNWINASWITTSPPTASMEPSLAYVAPPLDGIWATAPYLHNGSVPTLEALLESSLRPTYWRRTFREDDYNLQTVGWNYTEEAGPTDSQTYDTTLPGYGNGGHTFSDDLSDQERADLLEYLKSL